MRRAVRTGLAVALAVGLAACGTRGATTSTGAAHGTSSAPARTTTTSAVSASARVTVAPTSGAAATVFAVHFVAPASAGPAGQIRTGYTVSVTGGQGSGCLGTGSVQAGAATQGLAASVTLDPARLGSRWCPGTHVVRVIETGAPVCRPGTMCPQYLRVIGTVGVTRFTISR